MRSYEGPAESDVPGPSTVLPLPWNTVVKKGRRISLPFFSRDGHDDPVLMSNFFAPLKGLTELASTCSSGSLEQPVPGGPEDKRKR